ncbi:CRISPR-associated endonuclease Cas3'' [Streptomyces sp. NPDC046374]|uniref:CRISPR-associated endonuclease Cas3'' n=1 Tax=Streptomyces sp. NPDC046374 TaxID=3154917 RepID=UPI00340FBCEF
MQREGSLGAGGSVDPRLWGKQKGLTRAYPVICHLLDAAAMFGALWDELLGPAMRERIAHELGLTPDETRSVLSFWAGLHDLGKITPVFQAQVPESFAAMSGDPLYRSAPGAEGERGLRHEMATHWALTALLEEVGYPEGRRVGGGRQLLRGAVGHQVAQLLGGHHGCFGGVLQEHEVRRASEYQPGLGGPGWDGQRRVHFAELRRVTGAGAVPLRPLPADLAVVVTGLVVVADWLVSQVEVVESLMPPLGWRGTDLEVDAHWRRSRRRVGGVAAAAGIGRARFTADRFDQMFPFAPNPLQADLVANLPELVRSEGPGLLLVTAPTGDGKTEAALFAASVLGRAAGCRGMFVALPTMATADAMLPRVGRFKDVALTGERALMLLHSLAWLRPPGAGADGAGEGEVSAGSAAEAYAWLRGPRRGLLAPLGVGTIDQVLSGVLPLKYNVLRLFGLAEKVFVVDEAHAYGPWMHQLLVRLLEWLGALGAPVVLLSATLSGRTASSLVDAYRRGAGHLEPSVVEPCYPGWMYVGSASGRVCAPREVGSQRARTLDVAVRGVVWDSEDAPGAPLRVGGRREALRRELLPVVEGGGTALVCCTTVAEAQRTFRDLAECFPGLVRMPGGLRILHSRFPGVDRRRITAECEVAYGKPADPEDLEQPRPASILVATQVVEQSLDFDFDLVVSDLAPLAQLLQRAGRCRRHERGVTGRPSWACGEDRPRLVVLDPLQGDSGAVRLPASWGRVYDPGLLKRTSLLLARESAAGIAVPGDVQRLVDEVYAADFVDGLDGAVRRELELLDGERLAGEAAESYLADLAGICAPADVAGDLHRLSRRESGVTQEMLTTRLGADSGRVLCVYEQEGGVVTLDPEGKVPVPVRSGGLSREELVLLVEHAAPVPGRWLLGDSGGQPAQEGWAKHQLLRDLVVLKMKPTEDGAWSSRGPDGRTITISHVGLERE